MREPRYAIKTMTDTEVMEDGYKWRKYGQKAVKNSPHPRYHSHNLFRCDGLLYLHAVLQVVDIGQWEMEGQIFIKECNINYSQSKVLDSQTSVCRASYA